MIYAAHNMAAVLGLSVLLGAFLGLIYDAIRFFRNAAAVQIAGKYRRIMSILSFSLTLVLDLLFFIFCGISVSIFLFYANDGIFRLSSIATVVCGFCLYRVTLGKIIYALLKIFEKILKKMVIFSLKAIAFPIKSVYNILVKVSERFSGSESGSYTK